MANLILSARQCLAVSLGVRVLLAAISALLTSAPATAEVIENIATARWIQSGVTDETQSNRVAVAVAASPVSLQTFRAAPGSSTNLTFIPWQCPAAGSDAGLPVPGNPARTVGIEPANQYRAGELIIVTISAPLANRNPDAIDRLTLAATSNAGMQTGFDILETGPDTGLFAGTIATRRMLPGQPQDDCRIGVVVGGTITIAIASASGGSPLPSREVSILADPFGMVFDSETGDPVSGARITLRNADSGALAQAFAEDGVTGWPSTVISGAPVIDGAGNSYPMSPGRYWFPLAAPGPYRLEIEPPAPFAAPSAESPGRLAQLSRPGGGRFAITDASFGNIFALSGMMPVEIDIPVDSDGAGVGLMLTVSRPQVQPGDVVVYGLTVSNPQAQDRRNIDLVIDLPRGVRLRSDTIRIGGEVPQPGATHLSDEGRQLVVALDRLPQSGSVRVMMEDGSFAITDAERRYHLEGVVPGTHVVQIARSPRAAPAAQHRGS